jgi:hypothetical protein
MTIIRIIADLTRHQRLPWRCEGPLCQTSEGVSGQVILYDALSVRSPGLLFERGDFLLKHDIVLDRVGMMLPLNP